MGHIPDGTYSFIGNVIHLLRGPERSVHDLQRLAGILREARSRRDTFEQVGNQVRAKMPELGGLSDILPRTRSELYPFIAIILAIITLLIQRREPTASIDINTVMNLVTQAEGNSPTKPKPAADNVDTTPKALLKVGRNEPCPCGSGKKYKRCHGK
jgi:hypothetical protein